MGQLLFLKDITNTPWYFKDVWYDSNTRIFRYSWPNEAFPHAVAMHEENVTDSKSKPEIRRWVERNLQETVIYSVVDNTYHKYYGKERTWQQAHEIRNIWLVFHFEDEQSATLFKLAFSNLAAPITKHHPRYPEDEAWAKATPAERAEL